MAITLYGYHYSVYLRIVRMTLLEKSLSHHHVEVDPFADTLPEDYLDLHPFGRVPTLVHDGFVVYETGAVTRYLAEAFPGPSLQPTAVAARARMSQVMAIVDHYAYWPMVRQVFSQRVFAPCLGDKPNEKEIAEGLGRSHRVLNALEDITFKNTAPEGPLVARAPLTLADLYLAAMAAYFTAAPEGDALWRRFPKLTAWWDWIKTRDSLVSTDPGLPG